MGPIGCPVTSVKNYHRTPRNNPEERRSKAEGHPGPVNYRARCLFVRDIVAAGQTDKHRDSEGLYMLYKVMLLVWIVFGLGYLVMILGFITSAMRSKKVARLEHKLASNIKQTHSKLWSTLTRDVNYLRRVLNEMYVMTIKVKLSLIMAS
jgi:hypothetical protein